MDIELLKENLHLTHRQMAAKLGKSATTVRYWLKKHQLSVNRPAGPQPKLPNKNAVNGLKECSQCLITKPLVDFYKHTNKKRHHAYCRQCMTQNTVDRQRSFKSLCAEYKGGCCEICGYNKYQGALEFHHRDPSQKDFSVAQVKLHNFDGKIKMELDKCMLLCANCHREVHGGISKV